MIAKIELDAEYYEYLLSCSNMQEDVDYMKFWWDGTFVSTEDGSHIGGDGYYIVRSVFTHRKCDYVVPERCLIPLMEEENVQADH